MFIKMLLVVFSSNKRCINLLVIVFKVLHLNELLVYLLILKLVYILSLFRFKFILLYTQN